ncbi:MAG TPA: hypothetical protein VEK34_14815 [Methylocella sp.]|nr:hypothetical protein [Methylocella sp.]
MIEQVMIFALGFLIASLMALMIAPAFWARAIRLSRRRLEMQLPLSHEEILASRDLLRAEFAVELRRLEQKAEALSRLHASDLVELGNRAVIIDAQDAELAALSHQRSERGFEVASLQRALSETSAELAVTAKDAYDSSGLLARKNLRIGELESQLMDLQAITAEQKKVLASLGDETEAQKHRLAEQDGIIAKVEGELATLRLQQQADQVTLRSAAARIADREEALEAALKREEELARHRQVHAEAVQATEAGYREKIAELTTAKKILSEALVIAKREREEIADELTALRRAPPSIDAQTALQQSVENEILRQKINEIGAAIIRAATAAETSPAEEDRASGGEAEENARNGRESESEERASQRATA